MDCSRILEEDLANTRSNSRGFADRKGKQPMDRGKPYDRNNQRSGVWKKDLVGEIPVLQLDVSNVVRWDIGLRNARVTRRSVTIMENLDM